MATADDELLRVMFELSRVLLTETDVRGDLERVVSVAEATVPGCDGASVTVIVEGRPRTETATDRVVLEADLIQYRSREGPCLSAIATGEPVRVVLIATDKRFVRFAGGPPRRACSAFFHCRCRSADRLSPGSTCILTRLTALTRRRRWWVRCWLPKPGRRWPTPRH